MTYALWQPVTIANSPDGDTVPDQLTAMRSLVRPDGNILEMWALYDEAVGGYVTQFRVVDPAGEVIQAEQRSSVHVALLASSQLVALDDGGFAYVVSGTGVDMETGNGVIHGDVVRVGADGTVVDTVPYFDAAAGVAPDGPGMVGSVSIISNGDGTYFAAASLWDKSWGGNLFLVGGGLARIDTDWTVSLIPTTRQPSEMTARPGGGFYSVRHENHWDIDFSTVLSAIDIFDATGTFTGYESVLLDIWGSWVNSGYRLATVTALTDGTLAYSATAEGVAWNPETNHSEDYVYPYIFRIADDGSVLANVRIEAMPDGWVALADGRLGAWTQDGTTLSLQVYDTDLIAVGDMETIDLGVELRELSVVLLGDGRLQFVGFDGDASTGRAVQFIIDPRPDEITGTAFADALYGSKAHASTIFGLAGNDLLTGYAFADSLDGGDGDDTLEGGGGGDVLTGGAGSDTVLYAGSPSGVTIDLTTGVVGGGDAEGDVLDGIENVTGSAFADRLVGTVYANVLRGGGGDDVLVGGRGADTLDGGSGADLMVGGVGNDVYRVDDVGDVVVEEAGEGTDIVHTAISMAALPDEVEWGYLIEGAADAIALGGSAGANRLYGNSNDNILDGAGGDDLIFAGAGDDFVYANADGNSILVGGEGNDTLSYEHVTLGVTIDLTSVMQQPTGVGHSERATGFENLIGTARDDDLSGTMGANRLVGGAGHDVLDGSWGDDTLEGGSGGDTLDGGSGADLMVGGVGNDVYWVDDVGDVVVEAAGEGTDIVHTSISMTLPDEVEWGYLLEYFATAISLSGNAGANRLYGNAIDNILDGAGGDDLIFAGDGDDFVYASSVGNAILSGGAGVDTVSYEHVALGVTVDLASAVPQATGVGHGERVTGFENAIGTVRNDDIRGTAAANRIEGNTGFDVLWGNGGNDVLVGGGGRDVLIGGAGNDELLGGAGLDTASYVDATAGVTVSLAVADAQATGGAGTDLLVSIENLTGSRYADVLIGNVGTNRIEGGAGLDTLTGGRGADTFVLRPSQIDRDVVTDFEAAVDRIEVSASLFGAGLVEGTLDETLFLADATGQATTSEQRFVYETDIGRLYFDADGSGAGARALIASFTGTPTLTASMFDVVA